MNAAALSTLLLCQWMLPVNHIDVDNIRKIHLTDIGSFGALRTARHHVPRHYHTGIDILRPTDNYQNEPVFPALEGKVVSLVDNGPYSQVILEHFWQGKPYWTVYEHFQLRPLRVGQPVLRTDTLGFFFGKDALNRFGWQFDHLHFEINRLQPMAVKPDPQHPQRFFLSYAVRCYTLKELHTHLLDPEAFLAGKLAKRK